MKVNREWKEDFRHKWEGANVTLCSVTIGSMIEDIDTYLSQTRNNLLREIMEEMPKRELLKPIFDGDIEAEKDLCRKFGFNDYHDQVNTILESKLSTVKGK